MLSVEALPLSCCFCAGVAVGYGLRCQWTAAGACAQLLGAAAALYCLSDLWAGEATHELEAAVMALATAASAQDAELQPVRDISDLALPSKPYAPGEAEPTCSVCFEDFRPGEAVCHLYCGHTFHPACIYKWALYKDDCPMCRTTLESRRDSAESPRSGAARENLPAGATTMR